VSVVWARFLAMVSNRYNNILYGRIRRVLLTSMYTFCTVSYLSRGVYAGYYSSRYSNKYNDYSSLTIENCKYSVVTVTYMSILCTSPYTFYYVRIVWLMIWIFDVVFSWAGGPVLSFHS
jgi:hypothetical protein